MQKLPDLSATCIALFFSCAMVTPVSGFAQPDFEGIDKILPLLDAMDRAWSKVSDYTKIVLKKERLTSGVMVTERGYIKFRKPDQHYLLVLEGPNKGGEVIYPLHAKPNTAIAHAGGFIGITTRFLKKIPGVRRYIPTEFDIRDPRLIRGQHHTIVESNLGYIVMLIGHNLRTAARVNEGQIRMLQEEKIGEEQTFKFEVRLPDKTEMVHTVKENETLWSIAQRYRKNMYVVLYNNPHIKDPSELGVGDSLLIPRYYAPRGLIWISKKNYLPVKLEIFDRTNRLYESYLYSEINIDVGLSDNDFDHKNPNYNF